MAVADQRNAFPAILNLGCGDDFRDECLNLDISDHVRADASVDLGKMSIRGRGVPLKTQRFGTIQMAPGCFEVIVARHVLQQVDDLVALMTTCLTLLSDGGVLDITVPHDLSYGAWTDPANRRAFNETSWSAYADNAAAFGWQTERFEIIAMDFVPSALGRTLGGAGMPVDEISRTPRAIDAVHVCLQKQSLPAEPTVPNIAGGSELTAFRGGWAAHAHRHAVWIVSPPGYVHSQAFHEVALGLSSAFAELGGSAPLITDPADLNGRAPIVYGANLLPAAVIDSLPKDSVVINLEQVSDDSEWLKKAYFSILEHFPVLDYSERNRQGLAARGIGHAGLLEVGYAAALTRIAPAADQDIDVLFYGSLNERRKAVLDALTLRGLKVVHLFGVYGAERDAAIARARLVLNMHYYSSAIFEIVRVSYLLANRVCVVTEGDAFDPGLQPFRAGMAVVDYDGLVERCVQLVADPAQRQRIADQGFNIMARRSQARMLMAVMRRSDAAQR